MKYQSSALLTFCEGNLQWTSYVSPYLDFMMTSSNGNIFRVTGPLCGEFTGPGEFSTQRPVTRSFDVFFDLRLNKRFSKQPWGWWFETLSWSLWRHCNVHHYQIHIPVGRYWGRRCRICRCRHGPRSTTSCRHCFRWCKHCRSRPCSWRVLHRAHRMLF